MTMNANASAFYNKIEIEKFEEREIPFNAHCQLVFQLASKKLNRCAIFKLNSNVFSRMGKMREYVWHLMGIEAIFCFRNA